MAKQGRKIGSRVKLTPFGRKLHPQFVGKVGKIVKREILTRGHGLMPSVYHSYKISYFVRFEGEKRTYLLGSDLLMKA